AHRQRRAELIAQARHLERLGRAERGADADRRAELHARRVEPAHGPRERADRDRGRIAGAARVTETGRERRRRREHAGGQRRTENDDRSKLHDASEVKKPRPRCQRSTRDGGGADYRLRSRNHSSSFVMTMRSTISRVMPFGSLTGTTTAPS